MTTDNESPASSVAVTYEALLPIIAALSERISRLEAMLTPKASAPPSLPTTPWLGQIAGMALAQQRHRHFIPDYDDMGSY